MVTKGDMPLSFSWNFNGEPITSVHQSIMVAPYGKKSSILSIDSVDQSHIGNYTCIAHNSAGTAYFSAELFVKGMKCLHGSQKYVDVFCEKCISCAN